MVQVDILGTASHFQRYTKITLLIAFFKMKDFNVAGTLLQITFVVC